MNANRKERFIVYLGKKSLESDADCTISDVLRPFSAIFRGVQGLYRAYTTWRPYRSLPLLASLPIRQRDIIWYNLRLSAEAQRGQLGLLAARASLILVFAIV